MWRGICDSITFEFKNENLSYHDYFHINSSNDSPIEDFQPENITIHVPTVSNVNNENLLNCIQNMVADCNKSCNKSWYDMSIAELGNEEGPNGIEGESQLEIGVSSTICMVTGNFFLVHLRRFPLGTAAGRAGLHPF